MRLRCRATAQDAILIHPEGVLEVVRAAYVLSGGVLNVASACCPHRCGRTAEQCRSDAVVGVRDGAELPSGVYAVRARSVYRAIQPLPGLRSAVYVCWVVAAG